MVFLFATLFVNWGHALPDLPPCSCFICPEGCDRRRRLANNDAQLCASVEHFISENYLGQAVETLLHEHESLAALENHVSGQVYEWCTANEGQAGRRRSETNVDDLEGPAAHLTGSEIRYGLEEYVDMIKHHVGTFQEKRRRSSDLPSLRPDLWRQCAGYAYATSKIITDLGLHAGADLMLTNMGGNSNDTVVACAAVVNTVNGHLENGEIPGMQVVGQGPGAEVVVYESDVIAKLASLVGATAALASFTFKICGSYATVAIA